MTSPLGAEPTVRDRERFAQLERYLARGQAECFVGYAQAEQDCARLAERLLDVVESLDECHFAAIPRGGLVVLGMLAQILALDSEQLRPPGRGVGRLVLVDDCLLTGARFAAEARRFPEARIWFAHLYSHPDARAAIEGREARVAACVSANDLSDASESLFPDPSAREAWRARWLKRLGFDRYWFGQPEVIGFAWGEPTHLFWNEASSEVESGWRFFSPSRCLKNRFSLRLPPRSARRRWLVPDDVIVGDFDDRLLLFKRRSLEGFALEGVGRSVWEAMAAWGDPSAARWHLRERYEVGAADLEVEVASFLEQLESEGLLQRTR